MLLGAATPLGATPSDLAAPVQETAGTVTNPCVDDVVQGIGEWDCLPFYRWANEADSFSSNFGATEIGAANVMQPLVTFLYGMAGLMWRLLQWVTRTALAFDLFNWRDGHASTPSRSSRSTPASRRRPTSSCPASASRSSASPRRS